MVGCGAVVENSNYSGHSCGSYIFGLVYGTIVSISAVNILAVRDYSCSLLVVDWFIASLHMIFADTSLPAS